MTLRLFNLSEWKYGRGSGFSPPIVNISNHERFCRTPITQITPITPKESMDNFLASSSILNCKGVRFSSTYELSSKDTPAARRMYTHILNHRENDSEFGLSAYCNDDPGSST